MADYDNRVLRAPSTTADLYDAGLRAHMLRVYNYMLSGLVLTGISAWLVANVAPVRALFFQVTPQGGMTLSMLGWVALFAPLGLVFFLSFRINSMSVGAAQATFWAYAALVGLSLSIIFLVYTQTSIVRTFFITAAAFGALSLYGYTTKRDLSAMGSFLIMGLFGVIIASVVNIFLASSALQFAISVIGVLSSVSCDTKRSTTGKRPLGMR